MSRAPTAAWAVKPALRAAAQQRRQTCVQGQLAWCAVRCAPSCLPTAVLRPAGLSLPAALPLAALVALAAVPGFLVKQAVNVVQLRTAAAQLVAYDRARESGKKGRAAL